MPSFLFMKELKFLVQTQKNMKKDKQKYKCLDEQKSSYFYVQRKGGGAP